MNVFDSDDTDGGDHLNDGTADMKGTFYHVSMLPVYVYESPYNNMLERKISKYAYSVLVWIGIQQMVFALSGGCCTDLDQ